ncbi:MAG TPA: TonB-dependent receptor [Woeseiaceae bacterium]|nr:TonB-dependent receptor [Woeseiaceae bacterium]
MSTFTQADASAFGRIIPALIAALIGAIGSSGASAQDADGTVEEVVVTGYRNSLRTSLSQKRDSTGAVDVIVAEDIADFPDLNLAEALQRIPGVAITRAGGEGRQVTVRGLGPAFTTTRINGMEALSTAGFTDALGGNNRTRGFDFNSFDSELFNRLAINKTSAAELQEGGLGATLDLQTAQPFDFDGLTFAVSGQLGYNDLSDETDPRGALLISNTFADGKFGALFSIATSQRNISDEGSSTVRWSTSENFGSVDGVVLDPLLAPTHEVNVAWHPRIPRYDSYVQDTDRLGLSGSLQFRPGDNTEISLDALMSQSETTRDEAFMQGALNNATAVTATNITNYTIVNDAIVAADLTNARILSERRHDELEVDFSQYVLSFDHSFTEAFRVDAMAGTAESEFDNPVQRYVILQKDAATYSYDMRGSDGAIFNWGPAASDPNGWIVSNLRKREPYTKNTIDYAELSAAFDFSDNFTLKGGISQRTYDFETTQAFMANEGNNGVVGILDPSHLVNYDAGALGSWVAPNMDVFDSQYGFYDDSGVFMTSTDFRLQDTFTVEEETLAYFLQLDFAFDTAMPIRGNVGARYFDTDQNSTGIASLAAGTISADVNYNDTLPSLNLVMELTDDLLLRFGYAEVIARPGMALLRPVASVSVAGSNRTVNGNNPGLGPTFADAYDLGIEWYFAEDSLLGLGVFRKDISTFIQTIAQNIPYTSTGLPIQQAIDACNASAFGYGPDCNENLDWNVNAPGNSPGGTLDGFEISYQQPFVFLPGIFSNFGAILNYTYVDAKIDYLGVVGGVTTVVRPDESLTDLSENTSNLTLYYEDERLHARVSVADRDDYLTNVPGRNGTYVERTRGTTNVDFSAGFQLTDSVRLTFEALNLTNEAENQRLDATTAPADVVSYYHETGRQFYLGARFSY